MVGSLIKTSPFKKFLDMSRNLKRTSETYGFCEKGYIFQDVITIKLYNALLP